MIRWAFFVAMVGLLAGCVAPDEANRTEREAVPKAWAIAPLRAPAATPPAAVTESPVAAPPPDSGVVEPPSAPPAAIPRTVPAKRVGRASVRRHQPLPYPTCPAIALSYCLGRSWPAPGEAGDILSPLQVKRLRRCERDIQARAIARQGGDNPDPPPERAILGDRCARDFLKTRSVAAARRRSTR